MGARESESVGGQASEGENAGIQKQTNNRTLTTKNSQPRLVEFVLQGREVVVILADHGDEVVPVGLASLLLMDALDGGRVLGGLRVVVAPALVDQVTGDFEVQVGGLLGRFLRGGAHRFVLFDGGAVPEEFLGQAQRCLVVAGRATSWRSRVSLRAESALAERRARRSRSGDGRSFFR